MNRLTTNKEAMKDSRFMDTGFSQGEEIDITYGNGGSKLDRS